MSTREGQLNVKEAASERGSRVKKEICRTSAMSVIGRAMIDTLVFLGGGGEEIAEEENTLVFILYSFHLKA